MIPIAHGRYRHGRQGKENPAFFFHFLISRISLFGFVPNHCIKDASLQRAACMKNDQKVLHLIPNSHICKLPRSFFSLHPYACISPLRTRVSTVFCSTDFWATLSARVHMHPNVRAHAEAACRAPFSLFTQHPGLSKHAMAQESHGSPGIVRPADRSTPTAVPLAHTNTSQPVMDALKSQSASSTKPSTPRTPHQKNKRK